MAEPLGGETFSLDDTWLIVIVDHSRLGEVGKIYARSIVRGSKMAEAHRELCFLVGRVHLSLARAE